ncbi:MAG: transcriptional regulator, partial [Betaproteobacteria bacterium]
MPAARASCETSFRWFLSLLARHLDARIQAKGTATFISSVQQSSGHRRFEKLGAKTGSSPKSLIRMFGPTGNPQARNLFSVISHLQRHAGLTLHVTARSH